MIRYRTRDLTRLLPEPCPCGRTGRRMSRVSGRTDDMLIVKGVKFFPSQVESLIFEIEGTRPNCRIVIDRKGAKDEVTVLVEAAKTAPYDHERRQSGVLAETIRKRLAHELGITMDVKLMEANALEPSGGTGVRVIDNRKL
jgi:phenylacetate-CoA ligase